MTERQQYAAWGIIAAVTIALLVLLSPILLPFVAGMAIAYFLDPVADWLERRGLSRTLATSVIVIIFFLVALLLFILLIPVVVSQLGAFIERLPEYMGMLRHRVMPYVQDVAARFGIDLQFEVQQALSNNREQAMKVLGEVVNGLLGGGWAVFNALSLVVITPVVAFYLLRDWDRMIARIDAYLPRDHVETIRTQAMEIDRVLAGFVRGQVMVCLFLAFFYGIGLTALGLQFGLFIGITAGMISFIPYVGSALGFIASVGVALVQFWPDWIWIGAVAGLFALGQFIEGNFLQPKLVGDRVGLHAVWVIFALLAGGSLFGFVGVLLAVPMFAVIGVLARYTLERYRQSKLYKPGTPLDPHL
ncbi:AI-2E family transporter [uncultured Ferrovibrio sp.]|uniref:AI-2E family transporter n=1 Tax=uncultured Ferrovibrio sp. TaxID=1576913 RepID=UPI00260A2D24|nr:AI-2E family transporter [uncultured Ferrovibrio sp.]